MITAQTTEYIFLSGIGVAICVCAVVLMRCGHQKIDDAMEEIQKIAITRRNVWIRASIIWLVIYYWLILNSILTTLLVVYISCYSKEASSDNIRIIFYSTVSLFCAICPYVIDFVGAAKGYRQAFTLLDRALVLDEDIRVALVEGEKVISLGHRMDSISIVPIKSTEHNEEDSNE